MRYFLLVILSLMFASCKRQKPQAAPIPAPHYLSISDLKFPLLDEENGRQLFPKTYTDPILQNHILKRIAIKTPFYFTNAPKQLKAEYIASGRSRPFEKWILTKWRFLMDTNYYDGRGNQVSYYYALFLSAVPTLFYDNSGFVNYLFIHGDVLQEHQFNYLYLPKYRTLLQYRFSEDAIVRGVYYGYWMQPTSSFSFDLGGRLTSMISRYDDSGFCHIDIKYDHNNTDSVIFKFTTTKKVRPKDWEYPFTGSRSWFNRSVAKYYYNIDRLDSIVTTFDFNTDPEYSRIKTTCYNADGLATESIFRHKRALNDYVRTQYIYVHEPARGIKRIPKYPGYEIWDIVNAKLKTSQQILPTIITATSHTTTD